MTFRSFDVDKLKASLRLHEGVRAFPYRDTVGKLTIGVGHNLDAEGLPPVIIDALLDYDIAKHVKETYRLLPWVADLDDVRKRVFIELVFNLGSRILQFKNSLAHSQAGRWAEAANGFRASKWAGQVGRRADTLTMMLETGKDPQ